MIEIKANAKLNLYLDITGRLENGYHTLKMIMQSIDLCDNVRIYDADGFTVVCEGVPMEKNIAYRAGMAFYNKTDIVPSSRIEIEKHIPMQAGMGGGSADAAAALYGLNILHGSPLSIEELLHMAKDLGADVPFSLTGGCMLAEGIGEKLTPLENNMDCIYLIAKPLGGCSTPQAYSLYDASPINAKDNAYDMTEKSISKGDIKSFCEHIFNALTNGAEIICPEVKDTLDTLSALDGCSGAFMTGSGSACVGVFDDIKKACTSAKALELKDSSLSIFLTKAASSGLILE